MARYRFELQASAFIVEATAEEELPNASEAMAHGLRVARDFSKNKQGAPLKLLRVVDAQGGDPLLSMPINT